MKRRLALFAVPLLVGSLAFAIPMASHAGVDSGSCTKATPSPGLTPSGNVVNYPAGDPHGVGWVDTNKQQAGTKGDHGYFAVDTKDGARGYATDAPLNGQLKPSGSLCVSLANNRVTLP